MKRRYRHHRQATPSKPGWAQFLEFMELSTPVQRGGCLLTLGLSLVVLGPMVLLEVLELSETAQARLAAIWVGGICLGFTALVLHLGLRHGEAMRMSRVKTWGVAAMFVTLGLLGGLGLWFSES